MSNIKLTEIKKQLDETFDALEAKYRPIGGEAVHLSNVILTVRDAESGEQIGVVTTPLLPFVGFIQKGRMSCKIVEAVLGDDFLTMTDDDFTAQAQAEQDKLDAQQVQEKADLLAGEFTNHKED